MKFFKNILILSFIIFFNTYALSAESDKVKTSSDDFKTGNYEDEIFDPLENINRVIFSFNNAADKAILEPVARGYKKLPSPIQSGISNFINNLNHLKYTINNDPENMQALLEDLKNFKEENY